MSSIGSPLVQLNRPFGGCALVTLNRPEARNALSIALRRELTATFEQFNNDADTRVVVLTGAGEAFCAGLDLKELGTAPHPASAIASAAAEDPVLAMRRFGGPIVGAINGPAITGGFELALACDVLVASTRASFADTHARVGVLPGWGLSQRLPRLVGASRAKELSFTGNFLGADRAAAWGLVNRVVEPERLVDEALELAADMLTVLPEMLVAYKRLIDDGLCGSLAGGLRLERERSAAWAATLDAADIERRRVEVLERGRGRKGPATAGR
jgi:enoyl-CoA hydratase